MREVELKSVVADAAAVSRRLLAAGARLTQAGTLEDRRYDTTDRALTAQDHVLRLRTFRSRDGTVSTTVDWKGPTSIADGYKVREEHSAAAGDGDSLAGILEKLGFVVIREIEREIEQFILDGTTIRLERYPRMDALVEIEGEPAGIERAVTATGLPRSGFTCDRLPDFVARFEQRTGLRAALCDLERRGDYRYAASDG